MRDLLDKIEARQRLVRETVERLREQITELSGQLDAAERTLERLEITHATVLEPRHTESMRAKLKRLVRRGILTEPKPGLFTLTGHTGELGQRPRVPTENKPFRPGVIKFADSVIIFSSGGPMFSRAQHHHTDHTTGRGTRLRAGRPKGERQRCVT